MLTTLVNKVAERSHKMVLMSSHNPHNKAPLMAARALAAFGHQPKRSSLNCSSSARSSSWLRSSSKRAGPPHQQKEKPSGQTPASGWVPLSVPRTVMADRKRLALCCLHSPWGGPSTAFPHNLLKEVKDTLSTGILFYFVHALKEDMSCLPSTTSSQASSLCVKPPHA